MDPRKILIVEDEGIIANRLKSTLEMMGYKVCGAAVSGEKAVEMAPQVNPDLIIMDIHLAGEMNGIEAAAKIHESADVPIIYSTAYSDNFFLEKAKTTEPYSFLVKPVQDRELYAAIEMAFYRHAMDQQLAESEERYRIVSEIISDFAFSIALQADNEYSLEWITPVFTELTGFTIDEINKVNAWKKLLSPTDYGFVEDIIDNLLKGHEVEREFRILKRNREPIWVNLHVKPIWNEARTKIIKVYGAAQDITQRKYTENELLRLNNELELRVAERTTQLETAVEGLKNEIKNRLLAEDRLGESELRYRTLISNLPEYVIVHKNGKIVYFNAEVSKSSGYTTEEIYSRSIMMFIDECDREKVHQMLKGIRKDGVIPESEVKIKLKSGERRTNIIRTSKIIFDRKEAFLTILLDITQLRETQKQILNSEKKYRTIIGTAMDGFCTLDKHSEILEVNDALVELTGYSRKELLGMNMIALEFNKTQKEIEERINLIRSSENLRFETRYKRKNGSVIDVEVSIEYMDTDEAKFFCFVRNITDRKIAEVSLKESEDRYRSLIEFFPEAIAVHSEGKIIFVNPATVKLVGASCAEDLLGKPVMNLLHQDYIEYAKERITHTMETDAPLLPAHEKIFRMDGTAIDVEITGVPINFGGKKALQVILRDITEKLNAELQLRKLSRAVDQSPAGIVITDLSGRIQYTNPKFTEITGYAMEEVVNRNPRVLKSGEHNEDFYKAMWDTLLSGNEWRGELRNRKKSGELYWEFATISGIKNEKGQITHFLAVKEDITERKNIEAELIRSKIDAEEANNLKSSLLANMSHELRTPLNGILGFAQLLRDELSNQDQVNMLDKITKSGKRLMNTLNSVLMLTELENNNYLITRSEVDLSFFCHQLKTLYEPIAGEKKLDIHVAVKSESLVAETDEVLLTRMLSNILENAIKYTGRGSITIELKEFVRKDKRRFALINVIDTGMGIKRENQDLIFREFKQLSEGFRRDFEGLGLGLSLARKMANLINAEILVESVLGIGSIFTISIPLPENENITLQTRNIFEDETQQKVDIENTGREKRKVLLVEDNPLNVEVVQRFLAKNYQVDSAKDGSSAIEMAQQNNYEIFMIDINLGHGIDGVEVLKEIKKLKRYEPAPVIALTGYASETNRRDFLQQGFTHYLAKPFEKRELLELLKEIVPGN